MKKIISYHSVLHSNDEEQKIIVNYYDSLHKLIYTEILGAYLNGLRDTIFIKMSYATQDLVSNLVDEYVCKLTGRSLPGFLMFVMNQDLNCIFSECKSLLGDWIGHSSKRVDDFDQLSDTELLCISRVEILDPDCVDCVESCNTNSKIAYLLRCYYYENGMPIEMPKQDVLNKAIYTIFASENMTYGEMEIKRVNTANALGIPSGLLKDVTDFMMISILINTRSLRSIGITEYRKLFKEIKKFF